MTETLKPAPDWFDSLWEKNESKLPILFRGTTAKGVARQFAGAVVETLGALAKTPEGVRQIIAYARILAACKGAMRANMGPDPSPEQVAEFVERVVERVKP